MIGIAPIRVGPPWHTELVPACVNGHRELMHRIDNINAWGCRECDFILPHLEWIRYLENHDPR